MNANAIIIFVKNPVLGKAKTRLAKTVGNQRALYIYQRLLARTRQHTQHLDCDKLLFYSQFIDHNDDWPAMHFQKYLQQGGTLGEKMQLAFAQAFNMGYKKVLIIGSDCFSLTPQHINLAFAQLNQHNTVIGPALDGGYYLLGMTKLVPSIFTNKQWSTASVLGDTLQSISQAKKSFQLLQYLSDIDHYSDITPAMHAWLATDKNE